MSKSFKIQIASIKGLRERNEDALYFECGKKQIIECCGDLKSSAKNNDDRMMYGIFDGHGGNEISTYLAKYIPYYLNTLNIKSGDINLKINQIYDRIDRILREENLEAKNRGSAALMCILYEDNIKIINVGDSRAIGCNEYNIGTQLSIDHKPMQFNEKMRIEKMNGNIEIDTHNDYRICGLSLSRSFGDLDTKPYVSHQPEIYDYKYNNLKFIVLGCDGLWDVLSNQEVIEYVLSELKKFNDDKIKIQNKHDNINNIAYNLASYAINIKKSTDNVSIIIIFFN